MKYAFLYLVAYKFPLIDRKGLRVAEVANF